MEIEQSRGNGDGERIDRKKEKFVGIFFFPSNIEHLKCHRIMSFIFNKFLRLFHIFLLQYVY